MINIRQFICNPYEERSYLVWDETGEAAIVDPGFLGPEELSYLDRSILDNHLQLRSVLLTHAHFDHIYGVRHCVSEYGASVRLHPDEKTVLQGMERFARGSGMPVPDGNWPFQELRDGERIRVGSLEWTVIATPGHSPGSVCFYCEAEKQLFSGDTLFAGAIGNTQLPWADYDKEIVSIMDRLMGLDGDVEVHPGHGGGTTIGYERTHNPFLQPFNWKDPETGWVDGIETR